MNELEAINQIDAMNQMQMPAYGSNEIFAYIGVTSIVIQIVLHLLTAWGLWNVNKKLGEPHAWVSWIPVINIYSYVRAAGKSNIWILWLILAAIALIIPIIGLIIFIVLLVMVLSSISKRCGRGAWTTVGLLFIPFIMFPIMGHNCNINKTINSKENDNKTTEL